MGPFDSERWQANVQQATTMQVAISSFSTSMLGSDGFAMNRSVSAEDFIVSLHLFDVRQFPSLIEERLFRAIESEENFKFAARVCWHPVRIFAVRSIGSKVDVHRAIRIFQKIWVLRGAA